MNWIKRFLGYLSLGYCHVCGSKLFIEMYRGYDQIPLYKCPHCDNLDRFNLVNKENHENRS